MRSHLTARAAVTLLSATGLVAVAVSCTDRGEPTRPLVDAAHLHVSTNRAGAPESGLGRKLAALRRSTDRYHDFAAAQADGYTVQVTGCMEDATRGGMGYHYAKGDLIDGGVIEAKPEVLLYEPRGKGRLRLVGVEFIIPFTAWAAAEPPVLYGQTFSRNETFQVWALHVWVWRKNPAGVFADWNPKVSCERDDA
jgi:hypothetical protein